MSWCIGVNLKQDVVNLENSGSGGSSNSDNSPVGSVSLIVGLFYSRDQATSITNPTTHDEVMNDVIYNNNNNMRIEF